MKMGQVPSQITFPRPRPFSLAYSIWSLSIFSLAWSESTTNLFLFRFSEINEIKHKKAFLPNHLDLEGNTDSQVIEPKLKP